MPLEHPITKEDFRRDIDNLMSGSNLSFIEAVYKVLGTRVQEEIQKSGIEIACSKGCSACCYQLVTCTSLEYEEIKRYLQSLPRPQRRFILNSTKKIVQQWQKYFRGRQQLIEFHPERLHDLWRGKPCPFLSRSDGVCRIYPVRPIDCRTFISTKKCGPFRYDGVLRMHFEPEKWANNFILEEEQRLRGMMGTTPLLHWLLLQLSSR